MSINVVVPEVSEGVTAGTVISIAVAVGDQVEEDQTLIELETDKAVVAIPSPQAGKIEKLLVAEGDNAAVGSVIVVLSGENDLSGIETATEQPEATATSVEQKPETDKVAASESRLVVIGAGPGGYAAAFKAAELGKASLSLIPN